MNFLGLSSLHTDVFKLLNKVSIIIHRLKKMYRYTLAKLEVKLLYNKVIIHF